MNRDVAIIKYKTRLAPFLLFPHTELKLLMNFITWAAHFEKVDEKGSYSACCWTWNDKEVACGVCKG